MSTPENTACIRHQYFENNANVGVQVNYLPISGNDATDFTFTAPRPFQIIGVTSKSGGTIPNGVVGDAIFNTPGANVQAGFPYNLMQQSLAFANRDGQNQSGFMLYYPLDGSYDLMGMNFKYYFKRFLQDSLLIFNLFTYLYPSQMVQNFWSNEDAFSLLATYDSLTFSRFGQLPEILLKNSDLRMWNAPGTYNFLGAGAGNTDGYATPFTNVINSFLGDPAYLIVAELKSIE